jgi:hypothetical protein
MQPEPWNFYEQIQPEQSSLDDGVLLQKKINLNDAFLPNINLNDEVFTKNKL